MPGFPNRCQHIKVNGTQCGSPALRRNRLCYFHKTFQDERIKLSTDRARRGVPTFILPVLEDANSIQIALMQVMRLLLTRQIDPKTAALMLYALQTASTNLRMTKFDPWLYDVVLDPRTVADTPLDAHIWQDEDFDEEEEYEEEEGEEQEEDQEDEEEDQGIAVNSAVNSAVNKKEESRKPAPITAPAASVTATSSAVAAPARGERKPPVRSLEEIREGIREQIRKGLLSPDCLLEDDPSPIAETKKGGQSPPQTARSTGASR